MKKKLTYLLFIGILLTFVTCEQNSDTDITDTDDSDTSGINEDSTDYIWNSSKVIHIVLNGTTITVDSVGATVSDNIVTITAAGDYSVSGTLTNGQIIVNTEDEGAVRLILNGANITSTSTSPVFIKKSKKTIIILANNTKNYVTDATTYSFASADEDEPNAAIFSKSNLAISGSGSLTVDANYNDGISSKDGLIIKSGTIIVSSVDDGIRGKDYLIVYDGNITLNTIGDGMKSDNEDDTSLGYISIKKGVINITSGTDAIQAQTSVTITKGTFVLTSGGGSSKTVASSVSAKGIKAVNNLNINGGTYTINSADDGLHSNANMVINGDSIIISSGDDGIHATSSLIINGGYIGINKSYEGIESYSITVIDGNVNVVSSDDGFNASKGSGGDSNDGSALYLKGGSIYVNATTGDGLDSNGSMTITGGTILVHGPQSQPELGIDYNGTCNITGGFLITTGSNSSMMQGASSSSSQYSLKLITTSSFTAGTLFHIQDAKGTDIVTFKPAHGFASVVFSSPSLIKGSTYYIYTGGTYAGTLTKGLYTNGTYTPGTSYSNFTISSSVTSIGTSGRY